MRRHKLGSNIQNNIEMIQKTFDRLKKYKVYTNYRFIKKLAKLLSSDVNDFFEKFFMNFAFRNFESNKFEILNLTLSQKTKIDNNTLYRYEYRNINNLRILFVVVKENEDIYVLEAFLENGGKIKGKDSYDKAIKNAINTYIDMRR